MSEVSDFQEYRSIAYATAASWGIELPTEEQIRQWYEEHKVEWAPFLEISRAMVIGARDLIDKQTIELIRANQLLDSAPQKREEK